MLDVHVIHYIYPNEINKILDSFFKDSEFKLKLSMERSINFVKIF
jgi:hypothetical protein